jgi:SSS family transporter
MNPYLILTCILSYFALLLLIAWITSRKSTNSSYFTGNKSSPWIAVAFGLIADSLSGVTFISLPGTVASSQFSYMQVVLGYLLGYAVIAEILLPVYYRLRLTSIYSYLEQRFGSFSQYTGSFYFLLSRIAGAALRLALSAGVLQLFVFAPLGIPYWISVSLIILLMLAYTYKGGIKTLVWTDTLQSLFLLLGVIISIAIILRQLDWTVVEGAKAVAASSYSRIFFFDDWRPGNFFFKQFLSGAFIAIVMTGLDQNMMQKNLSCRSLKEAKKNIYAFSSVLIFVNLLIMSLGVLLYLYADINGISLLNTESGRLVTDEVFPHLAISYLGSFAALVFILALTASTFSSADSVLTTLTTSFLIDFLHIDKQSYAEARKTRIRHITHVCFALILLLVILAASHLEKSSILDAIFRVAAYTYGPLLGLFSFGLFTKKKPADYLVPLVCAFPPLICFLLQKNSSAWLNGYIFGYELLLINGLFTFAGLYLISEKGAHAQKEALQ